MFPLKYSLLHVRTAFLVGYHLSFPFLQTPLASENFTANVRIPTELVQAIELNELPKDMPMATLEAGPSSSLIAVGGALSCGNVGLQSR
jgi:hypothetical protein